MVWAASGARARVGALLLLLAACGGDARGPAKAAADEESKDERSIEMAPPRDTGELDALERDLDVAEQHLELELVRKRDLEVAAAPPPAPPPALRQAPAPPVTPQPAPPRLEADASVGSPCDVACRAYQSMKTAVDRICTLTHDGHERCQRARGRLAVSERRIADAGCKCLAPRQSS